MIATTTIARCCCRFFALADDSQAQIATYISRGEVLVARDGELVIGHLQILGTGDGFELYLQMMTAGGIRIVSFVADLVQGEWNVYLPDNTACGSATCRENFIWSFRKAFALLGAETGDLAAFEFDLQTRAVRVRVGGPGLFEQIEDPGTLSEDDEPPDDGKLDRET